MKLYALPLGAGLLVGIIYSLLSVRSPAPPLIALLGLLGILAGEQVIPLSKQWLGGTSISATSESAPTNAPTTASIEPLAGGATADKARDETPT